MLHYRNNVLQIGITIPDGWKVKKEREKPLDKMFRFLDAKLEAPGRSYGSDIRIEFTIQSKAFFRSSEKEKTWKQNGLTIKYNDSFGKAGNPNYYRFMHWMINDDKGVYLVIHANGKKRFDQALLILNTLYRFGHEPKKQFTAEEFGGKPRFFRIRCRSYNKYSDCSDVDLPKSFTTEALKLNGRILRGSPKTSVSKWTPYPWKKRDYRPEADCYYGNNGLIWMDGTGCAGITGLHTSGIFTERAAELLWPFMEQYFVRLPCTVDRKPHFMFAPRVKTSVLDYKKSEIERFDDGRIMCIERVVFLEKSLKDPLVFCIPEEPDHLYCTASIPDLIKKAKLKGLDIFPLDGYGR